MRLVSSFLKTWLVLLSVPIFTCYIFMWVVLYRWIIYFWIFYNNIFMSWRCIFFIIFIFAWFINYYFFFACLIFYFNVVIFFNFFIRILLCGVEVLLMVIVFTHFLYRILNFQWLVDPNFFLEQYFVLNPLSVLIFIFIVSYFGYDVFIVLFISDWVSRSTLKVRVTIHNFWCFL